MTASLDANLPGWDRITGTGYTPGSLLSFWVLVGVGVLGLPQTAVRGMGFKDTKSCHRAMLIGTIVAGVLMIGMHVSGAWAGALVGDQEFASSDYVIPTLIQNIMPVGIAGLFLASRDIVGGIKWVDNLRGETGIAKTVETGKSVYVGNELLGKKLGVIGLGAIGGMVANAANALGMTVFGYDPYITPAAAWSLAPAIKQASGYEEIFKSCDYITLHVPSTPSTKNMISEKTLSMMKKGVRIINLARADLVSATDIKAAIESGKVAKYVTDFPTEETVGVRGIINIPHLGASTYESEDHCAIMAAKQLREYLLTGNIKNSVNFPSVSLPHTSRARVTVMHKNIPNMLSQITSAFSREGVNIENLANGSKGDVAYTIVETDDVAGSDIVNAVMSIDGVFAVRCY